MCDMSTVDSMTRDAERIVCELCRRLRGNRSQIQLARRLGYRSNVPATWESGRAAPPATTFFRACERLGLEVRVPLEAFLGGVHLGDLTRVEGVAELIGRLRGGETTLALAEASGVSRHALGRWQRGESEPRLPDLLRVVDHGTRRLLDFLAIFTDPGELPSVADEWERLREGRALLVREPWVQPVLLGLELAGYRALAAHDDGWLARRLGESVERVQEALERLAATDQIAWTGTHWRLHRVRTIDTRRDADGVLAMRVWFAEQALGRLRAGAPEGTFSQNLFTLSEEDLERLHELHVRHFEEIRALVAQSEPGERIVFLQRSIVPWDGA